VSLNAKNALYFTGGILAALVLFAMMFPPAFSAEAMERIPVLAMQLDGTVDFKTVKLPIPPEPLAMHVCVQEFEASAIRCYAVNTDTSKWEAFDINLVQ